MTHYIDKGALKAEIKRRIKQIEEIGTLLSPKGVLTNLLCHLDVLETKEVDLEKELTIQEKAKAYDEAKYIMKKYLKSGNAGVIAESTIKKAFPELKESEDEKIRMELIQYLKDYPNLPNGNYCRNDFFAWLEKQGQTRKITHEEICKSYGIPDIGEFSDGYHTFNGLYKQRMILFAVLVNTYKDRAWKSWKHEDGLDCFGGGWFIVGIDTPAGTYTYHYEAKDWDKFDCQVLDKAKHWDGHDESDVERLFSLLEKQGEKNTSDNGIAENIKAKIIDYFDNHLMLDGCFSIGGLRNDIVSIVNEVKQSEQKPADKVEFYILDDGIDGGETRPTIEWVNKTFHLWSIQDAKDGDVLVASDGSIFILASVVDCSCKHYAALDTDGAVKFNEGLEHYWETLSAVHPATKEQRDQLEKAMADAGWEFDFEKKELKKIEPKPAWSEEDEEMLKSAISFVKHSGFSTIGKGKSNVIAWLKSFKERN